MGAGKTVRKIITIQTIVTLLVAIVSFVIADAKAAYSAGIGGGISIVTTAYFAAQVFSARRGAQARKVAQMLFLGEVVKIALTVALFALVLAWLDVSFLPLLLTYTASLFAYWLVLPFSL
ncbi:MAG: ATP synthase subunit I [Candidatus Competibacteraceae bacterium]|nr:ATP synthase subunit I [Candidatus Competibacteraceae bacterium]